MRCPNRTSLIGVLYLGTTLAISGCGGSGTVDVPGVEGARKTVARVRAERRLYDGAPPIIPHDPQGAACSSCHNDRGVAAEELGFAPPSPHSGSAVEAYTTRCRQCHVQNTVQGLFVANSFIGLPQNMRYGGRLTPISPPTIPHRILMRENCLACHTGPAVRQEIATTHPERARCRQCHVEEASRKEFESVLGEGLVNQNEQE
jgi:cytochrome c-type protein NapB